jgi:cytochrome c556
MRLDLENRMMKAVTGASAVAAAIMVAAWGMAGAAAQDNATIIKDRRAAMMAQGEAMFGIKKYLDGEADQAAGTRSADTLVRLARALRNEFPKGTSTTEFPGKSGAKPSVWTEWDRFIAAQKAMVDQAEMLDTAVKAGDKKAASNRFSSIARDGCLSCHSIFREKLDQAPSG